jgi:UDP-N-acetylmuramyl pentapeptide phosphotransferase/UDP-N-acetylglucosamine-1-phosphate transferase
MWSWTLLIPFISLGAISFTATYLVVPWLIRALVRREITEKDLHRLGFPKVPTMGGVAVFAGFAAAMTLSAILQMDYRLLFAIFLSGTLAVLAGAVDDLFRFSRTSLVLLTFLISIPVITFRAGTTLVYLTPIGPADLGWFFWLLVPFGFAFLMNGVNIYAGFNGLEVALGFVSSISLGICALFYGSLESAAALFALAGGLLAFLKWNWLPARVFVGNSGTMLMGAVLAASIIAGTIKIVGVIALFPYVINFILRARDRFKSSVADVEILPNGSLRNGRLSALWAFFMYRSPAEERTVVLRCVVVQVIFSLAAVIFAYYHAGLLISLART